jgi:hypothetical protein
MSRALLDATKKIGLEAIAEELSSLYVHVSLSDYRIKPQQKSS